MKPKSADFKSVEKNGYPLSADLKITIWNTSTCIRPLLYNLFINDFYPFIQNTNLHRYADENTLSKVADTKDEMISSLTNDTDISIDWLSNNDMIANPTKFQAIFPNKQNVHEDISL